MRTVLPPLSVKSTEGGEQGGRQGATPEGSTPGRQARSPPSSSGHLPPHPHPLQGQKGSHSSRPQEGGGAHGHAPPTRYRMHNATYAPYPPYQSPSMAYPPGRHPSPSPPPSAAQQRHYSPPLRQHAYMGDPCHRQAQDPKVQHPHMPSHSMLMPEIGPASKVQIKDAMRYLDLVKEEYKGNREVYDTFLKTMRDYKMHEIDAKGVVEIILGLFNGNQKVIQGFNQFLPKKYKIPLPGADLRDVERGERHDREAEPEQEAPARRPGRVRGEEAMHRHEDAGGPALHPGGPSNAALGPPGNSQGYHAPHHPGSYGPASSKNYMGRFEYTPGRPFPPQEMRDDAYSMLPGARHVQDERMRAHAYVKKVKKHFAGDSASFVEFLEILHSYREENRPIPEVLARIKTLLRDDPALVEEFMIFLPSGTGELCRPRAQRPPQADSMAMLQDIKHILSKKGVYREFVKALNVFNQGIIDSAALILLVEPFLKPAPALFNLFRYYIGHRETDAPPHVQTSLETYRSIGSYRVLPEKYRQAPHSGQTPEDAAVLNNEYISCPTFSSESSTFIFAKKNIHEEALFRVEDERYEAELLLERISALILKLMQYETTAIEEANTSREQGSTHFQVDLSPIDKETLRAVYNASTDDIILGIFAYPLRALPVVLKQLRGMESQWLRSRAVCLEFWRQTIDKNFIKALDVKGYRIRNAERKTAMVRQFMKDLEVAESVEFEFPEKDICAGVIRILESSMASEEGNSGQIEVLRKLLQTERVFFVTPEIYCILRALAAICSRVSDAVTGKRIGPKRSEMAVALGNQEAQKKPELQSLFSLVEEYVLGNIDIGKFEDKVLGALGVSGTALAGLSGMFQNAETMIDAITENGAAMEMLARLADSRRVEKKSVSQLLSEGVALIKLAVRRSPVGEYSVVATRTQPIQDAAPGWKEYVKQYGSAEPGTDRASTRGVFLRRSIKRQMGQAFVDYGMESIFDAGRFKLKHVPGTEDLMVKKHPAVH